MNYSFESFFHHYGFSNSQRDQFLSILSRNYERKFSLLAPYLVSTHTLLDISTGDGSFLFYLAKRLSDIHFITTDLVLKPYVLSSLTEHNTAFSYHLFWNASNVFSLPFKDNAFDVVLSHNASHDLLMASSSPQDFFTEVFRVLRPNGFFILIDKVLDDTEPMSVDLQMEKLQHSLFSITGQRVFGLKTSKEFSAILSSFFVPIFEQHITLDAPPELLVFFKYYYNYDHWFPLFSKYPSEIRKRCDAKVRTFLDTLNNGQFTPTFCSAYLYIGKKN
ncbi:MAG: class I SAM-dependent methyltransferase [Candidatus Heimdallarchaeaceae archaeon]